MAHLSQHGVKYHSSGTEQNRSRVTLWLVLSGAVVLVVYWLTAYRSLAWWDNPEYALAAVNLGVPHAPGSLLLTLVGHIAIVVTPFADSIATLNLLAGLIGASVVAVLTYCAIFMFHLQTNDKYEATTRSANRHVLLLAAAAGAIIVGLGETLWIYATMFTPYILTPLFTIMILLVILQWWKNADRPDSLRWLILLGFLIGLDFSVHRTNAILIPGIAVWILVCYPRSFLQLRTYLSSAFGLFVGLTLHPVIMLIARTNPYLCANQPDNWERFLEYVTVKQAGGNFLINFFPRKADFVSEQVGDVVVSIQASFIPIDSSFGWLALIPIVIALFGFVNLIRRNRNIGTAFVLLFVVTSTVTVLYFNIPAGFFRSLHRHYLPLQMMIGLMLVYGSMSIVSQIAQWRLKQRSYAQASVVLLLCVGMVSQIDRNYSQLDNSSNSFAHDFAYSALIGLEEDAIVFSSGDNDTFPLWYIQSAEKVRPDVTIVNLPLTNTHWFLRQILLRDSNYPLPYSPDDLSDLRAQPWSDTTISIPVVGRASDFDLSDDLVLPDSVTFQVDPSIIQGYLLAHDFVLLQTIIHNQWRRPIYFMSTVSSQNTRWLRDYLRMEGYVQRLLPLSSPPSNRAILTRNLFELYRYESYSSDEMAIDVISRQMVTNLYYGFIELLMIDSTDNDTVDRERICNRIHTHLPFDKVNPSEAILSYFDQLCGH
ncbi:MAG: DUF2723 domain-containing protein [candidate division Zixibacteria bacterium]|nr:DUF2723 domain-containing protein [candidate division Zixibacteria bacterium]